MHVSALISCRFGLLGFYFFSFWTFGPSFPLFWPLGLPFLVRIWASGFALGVSFLWPRCCDCWPPEQKPCMWALWFLVALAYWAFVSFHFELLDLHFLYFGPLGCHFLLGAGPRGLRWGSASSDRDAVIAGRQNKNHACERFDFLSLWAIGPLFPFMLNFWTFISFLLAPWAAISC